MSGIDSSYPVSTVSSCGREPESWSRSVHAEKGIKESRKMTISTTAIDSLDIVIIFMFLGKYIFGGVMRDRK